MFRLIPLSPAHAAVAAELHGRCFADSWNARAFTDLLAMPGAFGLLLCGEGDAPLGLILARAAADEAEVVTLAVLPEARRSGLGGRLLDAALATAREAGAASMFLEVAADNTAALALYGRRRFQPVGRRANYYGQNCDAVVLRRDF